MNILPQTYLAGVIEALEKRVAPALDDRFAAEAARLALIVLTITANGLDDAVEIRVAENAAMRALFGDALRLVADPVLTALLREAAGSVDPGLKISDLDTENARLRGVLVELHTYVETRSEDECRALDNRIWQMLADFEAARAPRR
jgi:hypothetical protein